MSSRPWRRTWHCADAVAAIPLAQRTGKAEYYKTWSSCAHLLRVRSPEMTSASSVGPDARLTGTTVGPPHRPHALTRDDVLLEARAIVKEYGSTRALQGADLILRAGRIHALMGENGAGKSTLVQILVGAAAPTSGTIALQRSPVTFGGVSDAIAAGVVPIYQQSSLFPNLTVLENLFAFETAASHGVAGHQSVQRRRLAQQMLNRIGLAVPLDQPVASLSLGEKQLLEIARGLGRDCKLLVLDEPTAALSSGRHQQAVCGTASARVGGGRYPLYKS